MDEGLCCQNCSSNNCWLPTKPHQTAKKSRQIAIFKKSEITVWQEAKTKRAPTAVSSRPFIGNAVHISDSSLLLHFKCLCEAGLCSLAPVCSAPYKSDHRAINNGGVADNKSISSHPRRLLHHCPAERRRDWECGGGARWRPLGQCLRRQGSSRLFFFFF